VRTFCSESPPAIEIRLAACSDILVTGSHAA